MRALSTILLACAVAISAGAQTAKDFWKQKPYTTWAETECRKLLEDSPWAQRHIIGREYIEPIGTVTGDRAHEKSPRIEYRAQIRSAAPIRQALVRQQQLAVKYDGMEPAERQAFDRQAREFLGVTFPDRIVVYVEYGSNVPAFQTDLARYWLSVPADQAKNIFFLITPRGERLQPMDFIKAGGGGGAFQLAFPRQVNGRPLLDAGDKELKFEFPHPNIGDLGESRVFLIFPVAKMVVNNAVAY